MIRVLIADDHGVLRAGLQAMIGSQPDMEVVGQASDGAEALELAETLQPDVLLLDVEMPGVGGVQVAKVLQEKRPELKILVLTMYDDPGLVRTVMDAGASGFVAKDALGDDLLAAIRAVAQGRGYINVAMSLKSGQSGATAAVTGSPSAAGRLSQREHEVLELLAQGFTNQEIGEKLHLSPRTIGTYRARINDKLGLRTRADIVRFALEGGLLSRA